MVLKQLAAIFIGYFLLIVWRKAYSIGCLILLVPLIVGLVISISVFRSNMQKRSCIADCYFKESSMFYRFLTKSKFVLIFSIVSSIIVSIYFLLSIIFFSFVDFVTLAIDTFLIYFIYKFLLNKLGNTLKDNLKYTIVKNWSAFLNNVLMIIIFLIIQLNSKIPSFITYSLTDTIINASSLVASECNFINYFVKMNAELDAFKWWLIINANNIITDRTFRWAAWILLLLSNLLSMLGFSKYMLQIIDFTRSLTNEEKDELIEKQ